MRDLFISYSRTDGQNVAAVASCLKERGLRVWFDQDNILPSQNIVREIDLALEKCSHFLLFASKAYFSSEWATAEYRAALYTALNAGKTLVVVVKFDDVPLPALLAPLSYISFTTPAEVCDKIARSLHLDPSSTQQPVSSSSSEYSWNLLEDSTRYFLVDSLFENLGLLRQRSGSETVLRLGLNEHSFFDLTISLPLITNEMFLADLESEWRIYKVLKKTVNFHVETLRKGGLGIFQPAFEITLDEKMTELNVSRAKLNSQLTAVVPLIRSHESRTTGEK